MIALRLIYLTALAVWVGGLVVLGAAAPPGGFDPIGWRAAGADTAALVIWQSSMSRYSSLWLVCGVAMLLSLVLMAIIGPRPRPYGPRLLTIVAMLAITIGAGVALARTRRPAALPTTASRDTSSTGRGTVRTAGIVPLWSKAAFVANLAGGMVLLLWEAQPS